ANIYNLSIKPISNNLIQYNGQGILDVKYSDANSILQDVEMNLGSVILCRSTPEPQTEWGLQFDGNNDYMTYPILEISTTREFVIKFTAEFKASTMLLGNDFDTLSYIYCNPDGRVTAKIEDGEGTPVQVYSESGLQEGQEIEVELRRVNRILTIIVNGVTGDSITNNRASKFNTIGSWGNSEIQPFLYSGILKGKLEFMLDTGGADSTLYVARSYDFNVSGNSKTNSGQPILIDTISGENAIGQNMNTDDSNWVELN
ncbi:MAG: hypothetical protein GY819_19705, partial [Planctomycetaceae bacterium]|nr:hypothetical protein [Planctomycetaceae bacterium]